MEQELECSRRLVDTENVEENVVTEAMFQRGQHLKSAWSVTQKQKVLIA